MGKRFGMVEVIGPVVLRNNYQHVLCQCQGCGTQKFINVNSLLRGKSKGCQSCSNTISPHAVVLGRRYDAIVARCNCPTYRSWKWYGARGIECRFGSRKEFILWVEKNLPHEDYRGVEIDRKDNDGHYEPGNLRLVTRKENITNRRNTKRVLFRGVPIVLTPDVYHLVRVLDPEVRYSPITTRNLANKGLSVEQIIARYYDLPSDKPKGCTILPMPDRDIAIQYLAS